MKEFNFNYSILSSSEKASLKRNFNKPFSEADITSLTAYFKTVGSNKYKNNYIYYFCATLGMKQQDVTGCEMELTDIVKRFNNKENESILKRFISLLKDDLSSESLFLYKLGQLIKFFWSKGYKVNVGKLLQDLLCLTSETSYVKENWISKIFIYEDKSKNEKESIK